MPLVLIKEDGTGKVDANSFATAADGDAYNPGLIVTQPACFDTLLNAPAGILSRRVQWQHETLDYAPTFNLDFNGPARRRLTGDLALTATNLDTGKSLALRLTADATDRTLTFPADWKFLTTPAPHHPRRQQDRPPPPRILRPHRPRPPRPLPRGAVKPPHRTAPGPIRCTASRARKPRKACLFS